MTTQQRENLVKKIYDSLMLSTYIDDNGEVAEMGMGDMGNVSDAAESIVNEWITENNIIETEDKLHTKDELRYAYECATDMNPSYESFTDFYKQNHLKEE